MHSFLTREGVGGEGVPLAFAPHYYDPGCAPDVPYDGNPVRAKVAFLRLQEVARRLNAPVFLGEWGDAESSAQTGMQYIRDQGRLLRELGFSHCYWDDSADVSHKPVFDALREAWGGTEAGETRLRAMRSRAETLPPPTQTPACPSPARAGAPRQAGHGVGTRRPPPHAGSARQYRNRRPALR
jgi:hypothetical protein